ncbi:MAG: hypothetical protein WBH99_00425 [Azovibrio sp.]|uniref:hypothetical protein n=1 Tax=Azovibrio sp. TaxID=1872673 RepID=UPI003C708DE3
MSADLISPIGVDVGSSQVDAPEIQGFLALLETGIQRYKGSKEGSKEGSKGPNSIDPGRIFLRSEQ